MANPESFRTKVWLLIIDKVIIGAAIGIVFLAFYLWTEDRKNEEEEHRFQQQLAIERAALAGQLLPSVANTNLKVDDRANILSVLTEANAIQPGTAARLGQILLDAGVSETPFIQAIVPAMLRDMEPFLRETEPIFRKWQPNRPTSESCGGRYWGDDRPIMPKPVVAQLSHWRSAFATLVDLSSHQTEIKLNSVEFVAEHLSSIANLLSPRSSTNAHDFSNSDIFAIQLIGHLSRIAFGSSEPSHVEFISETLRRRPISKSDVALLRQVVLLLRNSREVFLSPLRGGIALPLSELLTTELHFADSSLASGWYGVRWQAGEALWRMTDCSVDGQDVLAFYLHQFVRELSRTEGDDSLQKFSRRHESGKLVRRAVDLLGTMNSQESELSIRAILSVPEDKLRHFPFLRESAERHVR